MTDPPRHKVFISFHHKDQAYKDLFVELMEDYIVDKSVRDGDIDDDFLSTETIRRRIRDNFIRDATVTVVLIGPCAWQRKHVDWEIGSSLRKTTQNSRCGLLGLLLPSHPNFRTGKYTPSLIPPRLADNCNGTEPYAYIYDWPTQLMSLAGMSLWEAIESRTNSEKQIRRWIHEAFIRRSGTPPNNGRPQFKRNRGGYCSRGWSD
ncbi:MAG: TIR domain-containing protein [Chloroflexi bacterium]|nr:TIR domain-containing protein [Chloroflexota bacterium]MCY3939395.1 TIR domain-containing protein [Chloroflexota bacterium]